METNEEITLKCKGGGSIINQPPTISPDGLYLYVGWKNLLRCYNVETGERVVDLDGCENTIVGIQVDPTNPKLLVTCSSKGEIAVWKWQAKLLISKTKIHCNVDEIHSFHLISRNNECEILLAWTHNKQYQLGLFTFATLTQIIDFSHVLCQKPIALDICSQFLAVITAKKLKVFNFDESKLITERSSEKGKSFTCIACNAEQNCVATGDNKGCILVWRNLLAGNITKSIYHWHTLPVNVLMFSMSGSVLYSGGSECVLVKWQLDSLHKDFLPRLVAPIVHLASAPGNIFMTISTNDNSIHVLDTHFHIKRVIQHLTWPSVLAAGIQMDPRTKSLVLNGHVGNVQFYSPHTMSLLYNLEIIGENKLTNERNLKIPNTEVQKIAINKTGHWLACAEERHDKDVCLEVRLKFFHFDETNQTFTLNTSIEYPHENGINSLEFQPTNNLTDFYCATSGNNKQFKIWQLVDTSDIYHKNRSWRCINIGYYKDMESNALSFSTDGSLLAVAFGPCLTIWTPDTSELKCSLAHAQFKQPLRLVQFGHVDQCHLVVTASSQRACVWNLMTLGLIWTVPIEIEYLCADPLSTYMAAVTRDNDLFIFSPGVSSPEYLKKNFCGDNVRVTAATFVPHNVECNSSLRWQNNSHLYVMTSNQELLCLETETETDRNVDVALEYTPQTPSSMFNALSAETISIGPKPIQNALNHWDKGLPGSTGIKQLLEPPIHTMAPMRLLCSSVLRSLIIQQYNPSITNGNQSEDESMENANRKNSDSDSDSDVTPLKQDRTLSVTKQDVINRNDDFKAILNENVNWTAVLLD